jgi:hypothetical protein
MTHPIAPGRVDPYEVAYLRGGRNELARVIIISLVERQLLELSTPDTGLLRSFVRGTRYIRQRNPRVHPVLSQVEQAVYGWFGEPRSTADVFRQSLPGQLSTYCLQLEERLQRQQLVNGDEGVLPWPLRLVFRRRLTAQGRAYLAQLRSRTRPVADPAPYAFAAAVAGTSALAATPLSDLGAEFKKSERQDASGCGGWAGWSGGCGGVSCSGGCGGASGCGGGGGCGGG